MEDNIRLIEKLLERVVDYGKTSAELLKLKALEKASLAFSSMVLHSLTTILIGSSMLFLNLGLAFWIGDITGKLHYGFLIVGGLWFLITMIVYLFMQKWILKVLRNYIIKHLLK
jgi:hypothetical protein